MWSERYLDVTIFQLAMKTTGNGPFQNIRKVEAMVHTFNPFISVYEKLPYTRQIQWFPDKLQNMYGYNLTGGFVHMPPYSKGKYDKKGHLVDYSGADLLTFNCLSKVLNFSASIVSSADAKVGISSYKNKSASGMIGKCSINEINIFITTLLPFTLLKQTFLERTRMLDWESLYAVVPIFSGTEKVVSKSTSYSTLLVLLIISVVIYVSAHLLKFDAHQWDLFNILQVLLGMPAPQEPTSAASRIFYISVIVFSFAYSSSFFGGLTSTNLKITTQMELNTFKDLENSGLVIMLHPNIFQAIFSEAEDSLYNLRMKSSKEEMAHRTCGQFLSKYKNVSCIMPGARAVAMAEFFKDDSGYFQMKVMKQHFLCSQTVMVLEKGSPYVERIDQVIIRMVESGLRKKWTGEYSRDLSLSGGTLENHQDPEFKTIGSVINLRRRLLFISIHGYLLSMVVFIVEILFRKLQLLVIIYLSIRAVNIH
ncbi:uncharacterized protein LOC117176696 [Belonocnema kinseyi]|uniref:uncharacterized protein LOC117176696 n=1 Tax=Belonocnema kinseyi TaxID=2817044 RepID=UPI00143CFD10|nr:uncharacterized protein LOC117176696 [Belonocnema kinseyi]